MNGICSASNAGFFTTSGNSTVDTSDASMVPATVPSRHWRSSHSWRAGNSWTSILPPDFFSTASLNITPKVWNGCVVAVP